MCPHNRKIEFFPEHVWLVRECSECGKVKSKKEHKTVKVVGCLDCGEVWVKDYGE